ncbi:hypothetical protein MMC25_001006 [Agyrium rufum]|nr:hypothetical protein [Agyrium rufum]
MSRRAFTSFYQAFGKPKLPSPRSTVFLPLAPLRSHAPRHAFQVPSRSYLRFEKPSGRETKRLTRLQQLLLVWRQSLLFRRSVQVTGAGLGGFVALNIETIPESGRRRFNYVSAEYEAELGKQNYEQIMRQYRGKILPDHHPDVRTVHRVLNRLIPASGLQDLAWKVHVIDDKEEMNAFVIPGGKVFVFRGILPICGDEDGLATVLGHEIAHNVLHHTAENISRMSLFLPLVWISSFVFDVSGNLGYLFWDFAYNKPGSRTQESEADHIGLMMMARSCYNPEVAVHVWERMEKAQKVQIPQFASTHPSVGYPVQTIVKSAKKSQNYNRIAAMKKWLPDAQEKVSESGCHEVGKLANDFQHTFQSLPSKLAEMRGTKEDDWC